MPISGSWGVLVIILGELSSKHILLETVCNQIRQVVGPDLDMNCLTRMVLLKDFFFSKKKMTLKKKSADNNKV